MLASFLVFLRPKALAPLGRTIGRSLHGLLLDLIRQASPELAQRLHGDTPIKPFTVSMLRGRLLRQGDQRLASPDETYQVRYTVLAEDVFAALSHVLLGKYLYHETVSLDGQPFEIVEIAVEPARSGGWARLASYEQLYEEARAEERIVLRFASPTTFRTGDVNLLFPLPVSVFGSYLRKWGAFSPIPLVEGGLLDFVAEQVVAERYELETRVVRYGNFQVNGFVGVCHYRVLGGDPERVRAVNVLADFALFAGTGQKTTQGLGQTKRIRGPGRRS
ncbi:MAG: CRISPR system precrRNA processing endoribonuclease RAMP protein Cas6 [Anaerolineae bacterium]